MNSPSEPPTSEPDSATARSFRLPRVSFSTKDLAQGLGAASPSEPLIPRANFTSASMRAQAMTSPPQTHSISPRSRPKPDQRARFKFFASFAGWASWLLTLYCFDRARPIAHKVDKMFGVVRARGWDESFLVGGVLLAVLALLLAGASLTLAYTASSQKGFRHPYGAFVLAAVSLLSAVILATRL